jgi:sarcosine oxidase subunit delta
VTRIVCPFCGPREFDEFTFRSALPPTGAGAFGEVYERVNRLDTSAEYWQHLKGCRTWIVVRRNPSTGEVLEVRSLSGRAT